MFFLGGFDGKMQLLKQTWMLLMVLGSLLTLLLVSQIKVGTNPVYMHKYSWLEYTDSDGGPEKKCNCTAILRRDTEALRQAKLLTITKAFVKAIQIPDEYYINATKDCRYVDLNHKFL